jgi:hypothetical protein
MKMRKLLHIAAIIVSSLASMITHGKAQVNEARTRKEKRGESELAGHHRRHHPSSDPTVATQYPPPRSKIDPSSSDDDIKNSKHAATWTSYVEQASGAAPARDEEAPAKKLDPALMASAERPIEPLMRSSIVPSPLPGDEQSRYQWKRQIVTTTFWIGENATHNNPVPNRSSCWDPHWAGNYGGSDPPE